MDWAGLLRDQIRTRAEALPVASTALAYRSNGSPPTVLFRKSDDGLSHGNFIGDAWSSIVLTPGWAGRLDKRHPQAVALPQEFRADAKELDSSNSSDALLMNCFCYPKAAQRSAAVLGFSPPDSVPEFGFKARIELSDGSQDETEVDMLIGDTFIEAKLTEKDFTSRPRPHVFRYRELENVFDVDLLPGDDVNFRSYQLIRNVLAAAQHRRRLVVLMDYRRPDLLDEWWVVHSTIKDSRLRQRCTVRFWQQVAASFESTHAKWLEQKYGV